MNQYYQQFYEYIENEDRESCVNFALEKLSSQELDIVTLYEEILNPALNNMECRIDERHLCIWKEHVRSSIIRTVIECCYPYAVKERNERILTGESLSGMPKVAIICPDGEYHEIGARIVSDFFLICGFDPVFVGGSTPKDEFISVIDYLKLKYIAISVTNQYNLVAAKRTISKIRERFNGKIKIFVGGSAFSQNPQMYKEIGADLYLNKFEDIKKLVEGGI